MNKTVAITSIVVAIILTRLVVSALSADEATYLTCIDGDTFALEQGEDTTYYRLSYIDTPEKGEFNYYAASSFTCDSLTLMLRRNELELKEHGQGYYGRTLVEVVYPSGYTLNEELIALGLAKPYKPNTTDHLINLYHVIHE